MGTALKARYHVLDKLTGKEYESLNSQEVVALCGIGMGVLHSNINTNHMVYLHHKRWLITKLTSITTTREETFIAEWNKVMRMFRHVEWCKGGVE